MLLRQEAITNAVVHRDYRLNRDIHIRIFDDRVEVESPGHLREFPNPPNVDAGEGVPMMFAQMSAADLYEPLYREQLDAAIPTLVLTLLNEERPPLWVQVSDWIGRNGPIANAQLREISGLDTLGASKQLKQWVAQGVLVALPGASLKHMRYTLPDLLELSPETVLLSLGSDNKNRNP